MPSLTVPPVPQACLSVFASADRLTPLVERALGLVEGAPKLLLGERDAAQLGALLAEIACLPLKRGDVLIRAGEDADRLFVVIYGRLRIVTCDADGTETVVDEIGRGDTVLAIGGFGPHVFIWGLTAALAHMRVPVLPGGGMDARGRANVVARFAPTVIACTPSYALYLGRTMQTMGLDPAQSSVRIHLWSLLTAGWRYTE